PRFLPTRAAHRARAARELRDVRRVLRMPRDVDRIPWQSGTDLGDGIAFKDTANPRGRSIFIAFAGYNVSLESSCTWATALYRASLESRGVRYIWAVQGPATPYYTQKEIGTAHLADALVARVHGDTQFVLVAAHSSGSYVAHELLARLE